MIELYKPDGTMYVRKYGSPGSNRLMQLAPGRELEVYTREAVQSVEDMLRIEDQGWNNLSSTSQDVIGPADRITNLQLSRLYALKDPLGKQTIRLWTDYTFGKGFTWSVPEDAKKSKEVLGKFWKSPKNSAVLSSRGVRKSSDKLLIDGEVFFALFLGKSDDVVIRWIDPLEITEIITDIDDKETVRYYRRDWMDTQNASHTDYYRDWTNIQDVAAKDSAHQPHQMTQEAIIYHLNYNTTTARGNPLLLPALDWIKQYRSFLASRIAVMLALAKFAWRSKVKGGQTITDTIRAQTNEKEIGAGSILVENMGVDTTPIKMDSGSLAAYQDGRMVKLQVCAAVGIPEQYYGDISIGNLATAKTVELPMLKMFQSYQAVWDDAYQDIDEIVLAHGKVPPDQWYIDRDFPPIAPHDVLQAATALVQIIGALPQLGDSEDVMQMALIALGVNDPQEVLDALSEAAKRNPDIRLARELKLFRESLIKKERE